MTNLTTDDALLPWQRIVQAALHYMKGIRSADDLNDTLPSGT